MAITFDVSPVEVAREPLATDDFRAVLERRLGASVEACGGNVSRLVVGGEEHAFVAAARLAFARHQPLVLSPDAVWLMLAQGLAHHVNANAEALRERFVRHAGKAKVRVRHDGLRPGDPANDWPAVLGLLSDAVAEHVGRKRDLVVCDFSTTGPVERAASEVVLLDALRSYFEFEFQTMCGIPRITLEGTTADWRAVRTRARYLAELGLEGWADALDAVLAKVEATAEGRVDAGFWRSFFKWESMSGGDRITGWINALLPYLDGPRGPTPNEGEPTANRLPSGICRVPFEWEARGEVIDMELLGGFAGVSQDPTTLALRPELAWAVRPAGLPAPPAERDSATGRRVLHVAFLGARGGPVEQALETVRAATGAAWSGAWFDVPTGADLLLRVSRGLPRALPDAVVLVHSAGDWTTDAALHAELERRLREAGRSRVVPVCGLWAGGDDDVELPPLLEALRGRSRLLYLLEDAAAQFEGLRERLAQG